MLCGIPRCLLASPITAGLIWDKWLSVQPRVEYIECYIPHQLTKKALSGIWIIFLKFFLFFFFVYFLPGIMTYRLQRIIIARQHFVYWNIQTVIYLGILAEKHSSKLLCFPQRNEILYSYFSLRNITYNLCTMPHPFPFDIYLCYTQYNSYQLYLEDADKVLSIAKKKEKKTFPNHIRITRDTIM